MDLLHGTIAHDQAVIADWEAQPVQGAPNGTDVWEYRVDHEPDGVPARFTGTFTLPAGTDLVVVAAKVLQQAAGYL
jgi:hypothetical protein